MAGCIPARLRWHTLVAIMLFACSVVSPIILLFREQLGGLVPEIVGISLLGIGSAALLGAALARSVDRRSASALQWRLIVGSAWVLNPILVVAVSDRLGSRYHEIGWWSGLPLAVALTIFSGRLRLVEGDPDWAADGCLFSPSMAVHWFFSRLVFIGVPMCLISFQVALYLPTTKMLPQGPEIGLFVCGGCVLISAKFCGMCACLARQRLPQAFVLVILLSADWISSLHLMQLIHDDVKSTLLLVHLTVAGIVQLYTAHVRLRLRPRWSRACMQRRSAREVGDGVDLELSAQMNAAGGESSDSDDERGPGSLPDGFHECLIAVLGVPPASSQNARRQFLCACRRAHLRELTPIAVTPAAPTALTQETVVNTGAGVFPDVTTATGNAPVLANAVAEAPVQPGGSEISSTLAPVDIWPDEKLCTVCQEEIVNGDAVRPLPKCNHKFHAACLERWAKTMREATRCPTCRRPALARKELDGFISISVLTSSSDDRDSTNASARSQGTGGASRPARPVVPGQRATAPGGRLARAPPRAGSVANLRATLGISEALAHAALECAGGAPDVAAHVLLEHRSLLVSTFGGDQTVVRANPEPLNVWCIAAAVAEANPDLASMEGALRRQLGALYHAGRLTATTSWADMPAAGKSEVFRVLLEDVVRRLEARA